MTNNPNESIVFVVQFEDGTFFSGNDFGSLSRTTHLLAQAKHYPFEWIPPKDEDLKSYLFDNDVSYNVLTVQETREYNIIS